jgi:hypothetical protein
MPTSEKACSVVNFTRGRVDGFRCPHDKGEAFLWDTGVSGLGLRVRSGGSKNFIFQCRLNRRSLRISIGSPKAWDISQARGEARRLRVLVDSGLDPRQEKKKQEEADKQALNQRVRAKLKIQDVWPKYIDARTADWGPTHLSDHRKAMQAPNQPRKRSSKKTVAGPLYTLNNVYLQN